MIKTSTLAGVATLALAALPMFALATAAHSATPVAVKVADIDTLSPEGARIYAQRVDKAAVRFCRVKTDNARLTERLDCQNAVRAEMADKLEARNTVLAARQGARMAQN
jgi:UrcA family protein